MSGNKERTTKDWLGMFNQGNKLREQYAKAETYASKELTDIQRRAISSFDKQANK